MGVKSESIHPRVFYGVGGVKKNTCAPRSKARLIRAKAGIEKHIAANPRDVEAQSRLANLNRQLGA